MDTLNIILFIYVILLLTNNQLLTPHIRDFVQNNRWVQYLSLIVLIAITVNCFEKYNMNNTVIKTALISFVIISLLKMDLDWSMITVIILLGGFIWNCSLDYMDVHLVSNNAVVQTKRTELMVENSVKRQRYLAVVILVVLLGTSIYYVKKRHQYGNSFATIKFIGM